MILDVIKISLIASVFSFLGEPDMIFAWYRKQIMKLPDWLNKPLGVVSFVYFRTSVLMVLSYYFISHNIIYLNIYSLLQQESFFHQYIAMIWYMRVKNNRL